MKGLVEAKGWDGPGAVIKSYRNLEQLLGADKAGRGVVLPKDDADVEGFNALYAKLGRPEKPEDYKLEIPDGDDGKFAAAAAPILHQLGITAKQAEGLVKFVNEYSKTSRETFEASIGDQVKQQSEDLKREWGQAYDQNVEVARRGARALGMQEADIDSLENAIGYKRVFELMHKVGVKLGEDNFAGDGQASMQYSPGAASERLNQLRSDKDWSARVIAGDRKAIDEKETLEAAQLGMTLEAYRSALKG